MFELSISTTLCKQHYIQELYDKLKDEIKNDKGLAIKQNFFGRSYFAIAVPDKKKEFYKSKILDFIVFMIIDDYKFNFFKENLQLVEQNIISQSFLKAISIFDSEIDTEIIKRQIEMKNEVLVDSFYYFKLGSLKSRWIKTATIINQNQVLYSSESTIEVLKYLTLSSDNYLITANVIIGRKNIKVKQYSGTKCFKRDFDGYSNFFTEIVRLNPVKINLKKLEIKNDDVVVKLLNDIFTDKIYYLN